LYSGHYTGLGAKSSHIGTRGRDIVIGMVVATAVMAVAATVLIVHYTKKKSSITAV
jgi:hypothetical protein